MSAIGPQLPPHLLAEHQHEHEEDLPNHRKEEEEEGSDDDYAPALPPDLAKRVIGPSVPSSQHSYHDDDDDDDIGPKPLPPGVHHEERDAVKEFMEKEEKRRKEVEEAAKPKALKRDEWMLVPPSSSDLLGNLDPTKLKARQFSRSTAPARSSKPDNSLWTETPAERQQRLADEVAGRKRRAVDVARDGDDEPNDRKGRKRRKEEEEKVRKGVDEYTRKVRGPALLDQHGASSSSQSNPSNGEAPPGIWDHGRDMALSGRLMDDDKRNKMVKEAKGLGDRFGAGKSGGFL